MEATYSSKTLVSTYKFILRYYPHDQHRDPVTYSKIFFLINIQEMLVPNHDEVNKEPYENQFTLCYESASIINSFLRLAYLTIQLQQLRL